MLGTIVGNIAGLIGVFGSAAGSIVQTPPVAIAFGLLMVGIAIGFIKRFSGARKKRRGN